MICAPGNRAIPIESHTIPAIVESGSLAVFAVDSETGERLHLFSLAPGDSLMPLACPPHADWEIAAVPLQMSTLRPAANSTPWALENWFANLRQAVARLQPSQDKPAEVDACSPAAVDAITAVLFESLRELKEQRETRNTQRFRARQELNRRSSRGALESLAGVTAHSAGNAPAASGGDPLLQAVRAAAAYFHVQVRPSAGAGPRGDLVRDVAQASGMRSRTVVLSGEWWKQDSGPLVGSTDSGSPVALLPRRGGYSIVDPVAGTSERVTQSTASGLNLFAQMLYQPIPETLSLGNLLRHAAGSRRKDLRTIVLAGACAAVLSMAVPQAVAILMGSAIPDGNTNMLWQVGGGLIAAAFGSAIFLLAQAVAILRAQSAAFATLQTGVWDRLLKLSPAFFRRFTAGEIRMRADAVTRIHQLLTADALRSVLMGAASTVSLALMFWYSPAIALIALGCGLAAAGHTWWQARALFDVQRDWQQLEEMLSGLVLQSLNAVSKLRVAGASDRAFAHWAREYSRLQKLSLAVQTRKDRIRLVSLLLPGLGSSMAFVWLLAQPIGLGAFLACNAALSTFLLAVTSACDSFSGMVLIANKWSRTRSILEVKPEVDGSKIHPGRLRGAIQVERLTFRYRPDGPLILEDVSIAAAPGECIAITGPSGSGKTTLLNLILRFETAQSGAIYMDGRELSGLDITAVRRQIGVVTQDGRIMAGSLFDNICPGGVNTMDEAWDAARSAGLGEDLEAMPMGMHTVISEGGGNLSGGQRQRVLIARALILKPSILIFDEATSALDNRTQATVTASLKRLKATRILVAHRLSTIRDADRIYVIDKGKVVQEGTFDNLAAEPGLFARLVSRQQA